MPQPRNPINVNIRYERDGNEVPEFECREACVYANYNWTQWENELSWWEKSYVVAQYRLHHLIESHIQEKSQAESKRKGAATSAGDAPTRSGMRRRGR